jgi:hypothetical protein
MADDQGPGRGPARPETSALLTETLIREGVGLVVMAAVLWYIGPGRVWAWAVVEHVRARFRARAEAAEIEIAGFRRQVSEWEHEQAAQPDH